MIKNCSPEYVKNFQISIRKQPSWFLKGGQIHKTETSQRLNANRGENMKNYSKLSVPIGIQV